MQKYLTLEHNVCCGFRKQQTEDNSVTYMQAINLTANRRNKTHLLTVYDWQQMTHGVVLCYLIQ